MKSIYKIILIIIAILTISELIQYATHTKYLRKYVVSLNEKTRANIDSASLLAAVSTDRISPDYLMFLNNIPSNDSQKLKFIETIECKFRSPVSKFIYDKKYLIQIARTDTLTNLNLTRDILEKNVETSAENNVGYALNRNGFLHFEYNNSKAKKPSKILLTIFGDQTQLLKQTDSLVYYFTNLKNMSVRYNIKASQDLFVETNGISIPTEILFCKKNGNLYLIIATVKNDGDNLSKQLLYKLFFGSVSK